METSDRGLLDIERFDLEPARPLLHGLIGDLSSTALHNPSEAEKVRLVLALPGTETISTRLAVSMLEMTQTLSAWPQLASDVTLGGATVTTAVRRLALGQPLPSGRRYIDLEATLASAPGRAGVSSACQKERDQDGPASRVRASGEVDARIPAYIRFVVEHGTLAPSGGNCQPWRFYCNGDRLWIVRDPWRSRTLLDPHARAAHLALGAAIENMAIAAAYRGVRMHIDPFPQASAPTVVAALSFAPGGGEPAMTAASLFAQLRRRVTNRQVASRRPLAAWQVAMLQEAAGDRGAQLHLLTESQALADIGQLVGQGERMRCLCPALHREMMAELRWTPDEARQTRDGIAVQSLELTPGEEAALRLLARPDVAAVLRELDSGTVFVHGADKAIRAASAVGLVTIDGTEPTDVVRGGRAVERLWLRATALDLALQPMAALTYMFEMLRTDAGAVFSETERVTLLALQARFDQLFPRCRDATKLLLFRLSYAPAPTERSLRLPVEQVLFFGEPPLAAA